MPIHFLHLPGPARLDSSLSFSSVPCKCGAIIISRNSKRIARALPYWVVCFVRCRCGYAFGARRRRQQLLFCLHPNEMQFDLCVSLFARSLFEQLFLFAGKVCVVLTISVCRVYFIVIWKTIRKSQQSHLNCLVCGGERWAQVQATRDTLRFEIQKKPKLNERRI